jgi:bifunctional non-homologous end joining protein LigD
MLIVELSHGRSASNLRREPLRVSLKQNLAMGNERSLQRRSAAAIPAPMRATPGGKPFSSADWIFEIKYDGYRCMARIDKGSVELRTKNGAECTTWYPEVAQLLGSLAGGPHVIDGEATILDEIGRSDFERLHARARRRRWIADAPVTYCAFDLLFHDGQNIMGLPLLERKARLAKLLQPLRGKLVIVGEFPAEAELFEKFVVGAQLEGFVAKAKSGIYRPGTVSPEWVKLKRKGAVPAQRFTR